ncbi:MAG: RNA polymerase sigma factor [Polyangiaceae bacterium]|nr:RNA polymerase sigma factor [Polyangiaceae bacterium]
MWAWGSGLPLPGGWALGGKARTIATGATPVLGLSSRLGLIPQRDFAEKLMSSLVPSPSTDLRTEVSVSAEPLADRELGREVSGVQEVVSAEARLVESLVAGELSAKKELYDRYGSHVHRILLHTLGREREVADLLHDVFISAIEGISGLKNPAALKGWLTSIAVFSARSFIKRRRRRNLLGFLSTEEVPVPAAEPSQQVSVALRTAFKVLEKLPTDERIAFSLRYIEGLSLKEVAEACGAPEATTKHRITRAQQRFFKYAKREPLLGDWLKEGA